MLEKQLIDQSVVVIGGGGGIGAAVAAMALKHGARVFALGRTGSGPDGATCLAVDASQPDALRQTFVTIGSIDHLVYTAGARSGARALPDVEDDDVAIAFQSKLFGAIQAVRTALPQLADQASITLTSGQVSRKYGTGSLVTGPDAVASRQCSPVPSMIHGYPVEPCKTRSVICDALA